MQTLQAVPHVEELAMDAEDAAEQAGLRWVAESLAARVVPVPRGDGAGALRAGAVVIASGNTRRALLTVPVGSRSDPRSLGLALERAGFRVEGPANEPLDARDVRVLHDGHGALLGHGYGSSRTAARRLESFVRGPVLPLELADAALPQLARAAAVLADGTALVCPEALRPRSLALLRDHPAVRRLVRVPRAEAQRGGLEVLELGDVVLIARRARWVGSALGLIGHRVVGVDLQQGANERRGRGPAALAAPLIQVEVVHAAREPEPLWT